MAALCRKCLSFFKKEVVLCVAALLAAASCFLSPPSAAYLTYIDWNTLALLFGLMAVMQGLQKANFFVYLASLLLGRIRSTRTLVFLLVFLPFVCSMVITNDVSLIAFVPFGITILRMAGQERLLVPQVVLQTIAANLGSMLTPMGNPQNLYLYNQSGLGFGPFCGLLLPYVLVSALLLAVSILLLKPAPIAAVDLSAGLGKTRDLLCYGAGFGLCLLGVFKVLPAPVIALIAALFLLFYDRQVLAAIDYSLLGTFVAFFLFVGNISQLAAVQNFLASILEGRVELVSILTSQVISNVPAALLLSGFTSHWQGLIVGCNLGAWAPSSPPWQASSPTSWWQRSTPGCGGGTSGGSPWGTWCSWRCCSGCSWPWAALPSRNTKERAMGPLFFFFQKKNGRGAPRPLCVSF